jgi:hypothetical protein
MTGGPGGVALVVSEMRTARGAHNDNKVITIPGNQKTDR